MDKKRQHLGKSHGEDEYGPKQRHFTHTIIHPLCWSPYFFISLFFPNLSSSFSSPFRDTGRQYKQWQPWPTRRRGIYFCLSKRVQVQQNTDTHKKSTTEKRVQGMMLAGEGSISHFFLLFTTRAVRMLNYKWCLCMLGYQRQWRTQQNSQGRRLYNNGTTTSTAVTEPAKDPCDDEDYRQCNEDMFQSCELCLFRVQSWGRSRKRALISFCGSAYCMNMRNSV